MCVCVREREREGVGEGEVERMEGSGATGPSFTTQGPRTERTEVKGGEEREVLDI